ncbi:GNAT family N-acetyltransferase [Rufibacter immobilis]|uniref:GNAT family N-acetyltransferase n=1 Tax=Rufibacter immobilis TaxID=1348778 RepID=UPI0035E9199A
MTAPTHSQPITVQPTSDIALIQELAYATWQPTYEKILSQAQIDFMLTEIYSPEALRKQMDEGQTFLLLRQGETPAAFASFSLLQADQKLYKLNKLYIHPLFQGRGFGKILLEEVTQRAKAQGAEKLELNVHRQNPAFHFYQKHGFEISQIIDIPFGQFTLNDYILHKKLSDAP